jgi:hypothetical protein
MTRLRCALRFPRFGGLLLLTGALLLSACTGPQAPPLAENAPSQPAAAASSTPLPTQALPAGESPSPTPQAQEPIPAGAQAEFRTDFSRRAVPFAEILSGGPPKDGIPAIDNPKFIPVEEARAWLQAQEPVAFVQVSADARAYPLQILVWHEIVNDTVGELPLVVTYCPLCNTAIAFGRAVDGQTLDFGTTGRLRFSNLIMYDRQTETWWQQANGQAIIGSLTGTQLIFYPAAILSWQEFADAFPDGKVLSRETGFLRDYGRNPYTRYDAPGSDPFLYQGPDAPTALAAMARVLTIDLNGEAIAYPYQILAERQAINDTVGGQAVVVFWAPGTASALDTASLAAGREVGAASAFARQVDGRLLTFTADGGVITDQETGSQWDIFGRAVAGELAGQSLAPVVAINHFWFSWAAFKPETRIYTP